MPEIALPPNTTNPAVGPRDAEMLKVAEAAEAQNKVAAAAEAAARAAQSALDNANKKAPATETKPAETKAAEQPGDGTIKPATEEQKILGKFKTQADLEKAYTELEAKLSAKPGDKPAESKPLVSNEEMTEYAQTVTATGDLTSDHYAELAKRGLAPEIVRGYVEGLKARAAEHLKQTYEVAGGEAGYKAMADWASKNVPDAELQVYNQDVKSGDKARVSAAVTGLYSRFVAAGNSPATRAIPSRTSGSVQNSGGGVQKIGSSDELVLLMGSPDYKMNPAVRDEVARRLAASQGI
jgi:capsid assembly protein